MKKVRRREIDFPMSRNNGDEEYYAFRIKEWKTLPTPIVVKDEWVNEPKFTSLFLLEHSQQSFELFNIHSEEEYRLGILIFKHRASHIGSIPVRIRKNQVFHFLFLTVLFLVAV